MWSASMRYPEWEDYGQADQSRPGIRDVMVRSVDGGRTWNDPTIVHPYATETAYAVDPADPDHLLAATRLQRYALSGEDPEQIKRAISGVPYPPELPWCYKNGLLIGSQDGGRTFQEREDGLYGFGSYRWTALWTEENRVLLVSFAGSDCGEPDAAFDNRHVVRLSLDGGPTWVSDTPAGNRSPNRARKFTLVPVRADDDYSDIVAVTVPLAPNRFFTTHRYKQDKTLVGLLWHFEGLP